MTAPDQVRRPVIRPDVVALLADVRIDIAEPASTWRHNDGRPLAEDEINRILTATTAEACAALDYAQLDIERYEQLLADIARAEQLAAPYVAQLGPGAGVAEVLAAMVGPEREELRALAEQIAFFTDTDTRSTP